MRLFIAEKPSLARAIADVLPKPHRKGDGFIECGNGQVVTGVSVTCLNRRSRMSTTAATPAGISTICRSCRKSGVCNRVLPSPNSSTSLSASCMRRRKWSTRVTRTGKGNCWSMKCWTTRAGAGKASAGAALPYQRPQPAGGGARDFAPARQQRIYSPVCLRAGTCPRGLAVRDQHDPRLHHPGRNAGYQGVLSVGRVQTPVLGLVVRRDEEIENFVAKDFFEVKAHIVTPKDERFTAVWQPSDACESYQDEEGRLLHRPLAEHVVNRITGQPAIVTSYNDKRESEPAPLPFSFRRCRSRPRKVWPERAERARYLPKAL